VRISVALATYQGARFLEQQLDSIAAQATPPDELVVSDDGSADETVALVDQFAARAPFPVARHVNDRRLGPARNFEAAIRRCRGDVVALADQDDVWLPQKLARLRAAFAAAGSIGLAFSDCELIDEQARPLGTTGWTAIGLRARDREAIDHDDAFRVLVARQHRAGGTVTGATMAFRAAVTDLAFPLPDAVAGSGKGLLHDGWIALAAAAVAPVGLVPESLVRHRQHPGQEIGMTGGRRTAGSTAGGRDASIAWMRELRSRLVARAAAEPRAAASVAVLDGWLRHFDVRDSLPAARLRRIPVVGRELVSGRYHAYSSGLRSAARDLAG
jgi:hypothetical protein